MAKRIDIESIKPRIGSGYPAPFGEQVQSRERRAIGDAAGLTRIGVTLLRLPTGAWSTQRHWHINSDELVYVVAGEVFLVTDAVEEVLKAGDAAGFKCGNADGHHLQNRSLEDALLLEIGDRPIADTAFYPDIDLVATITADGRSVLTRRDGSLY
jgi:uncharacterized cupin superfamily protein